MKKKLGVVLFWFGTLWFFGVILLAAVGLFFSLGDGDSFPIGGFGSIILLVMLLPGAAIMQWGDSMSS